MENEGDVLKQACKSIRKFSAQNEVLRIPALENEMPENEPGMRQGAWPLLLRPSMHGFP